MDCRTRTPFFARAARAEIPKRDWATAGMSIERFDLSLNLWDPETKGYNVDKLPWDLKASPETLWPVLQRHVDLETMVRDLDKEDTCKVASE